MEVIDLGLSDLEPISLNFADDAPKHSVNFGSGIELLMNDKKKASNSRMDLGELDSLEAELNDLSGMGANYGSSGDSSRGSSSNYHSSSSSSSSSGESKTLSGLSSGLFNMFSSKKPDEHTDSNVGQATRESIGTTKTWDGYAKINEVPIHAESSASAKLSDRERRRKKRLMIKKIEEWYEKGLIKNNPHFNMDSSFEEVEDEYETALEDKRKKDGVKLQGWWFMTFINSLEYANTAFNPFDLNLEGWGEQVSEDLESYEEIFAELHDKYKGGKLAPEISLLLRVGFSAAVLNFSNKALSSATPAFNDVIKQNPELMRMFTNATVNSMSQQSPGFAFANNFVQEQSNKPRGPPPPAPVETKNQPPPSRPGMTFTESAPNNRPDIAASRSPMFREQGVDAGRQYSSAKDAERISLQAPAQAQRPEMRGPQSSDIDNILAGLKTRNVNIHEPKNNIEATLNMASTVDEDSMISISSLKDIQNSNAPKKSSRRRNISDKNVISLDI